jgi:hypothetical protein
MGDSTDVNDSWAHWLRWLVMVVIAVGGVAAARRWALAKADAEFEARLLAADEQRH